MRYVTNSQEQTIELGRALAIYLAVGDCLALNGDLGAGKTALVFGITRGMGYDDYISSPTFTIVNEYPTNIPIFHFDVYRVNDPDELYAIGFDEYFYREGIVIVEWAKYIKELMPKDLLNIYIKQNIEKPNQREIEFIANGERYEKLLRDLSDKIGGNYESFSS